jgi:hypothetical protein
MNGELEHERTEQADARAPVAACLRGTTARAILERLGNGDPLELERRCAERLRATGYLLHPLRLHLRAAARVAFAAARGYDGEPALDRWLEERIDQAIHELLLEDADGERIALPPAGAGPATYYALIPPETGVAPGMARELCVRFNRLPARWRRAFRALVVEREAARAYARRTGLPTATAIAYAREALEALHAAADDATGG